MGRGRQMSFGPEKPVVGPTVVPRKLICAALFAAFLPFAITRSYMYYMGPSFSEDAAIFFEGQPTEPLKEDASPLFNLNSSQINDVAVQPDVPNRDTTSGSLKSFPVAENTPNSGNESESTLLTSPTEKTHNGSGPADSKAKVGGESSSSGKKLTTSSGDKAILREKPDKSSKGDATGDAAETEGACDLVQGEWVPDPRPPNYSNQTCRFIQGHQNCLKNGRPDRGFLRWKWKPKSCELPRLDAPAFLTAMRNRSMAFVGDSIARNQFQSLLCLLSQVDGPQNTYHSPDDRDNVHLFPTFNFTLAIYWSAYLVRVDDKMVTWPDNKTELVAHIHVDELDDAWVNRVSNVDILQVSTGQWWFKRGLFLRKRKPLGGHICDGWEGCDKEIGFADPYRAALHSVLKGSLSAVPGFKGVTVLRTFGPDHFEGGRWDTGGQCARTSPGGVPPSPLTHWMYGIQKEEFLNVTGEVGQPAENRLKLLDITPMAQIRADGHPNAYREFQPFAKENTKPIQNDCLHWCLPGPIDTWNDLLVESLREIIYRR